MANLKEVLLNVAAAEVGPCGLLAQVSSVSEAKVHWRKAPQQRKEVKRIVASLWENRKGSLCDDPKVYAGIRKEAVHPQGIPEYPTMLRYLN